MPKRGPREEEPFSPIDAHMVDALLRPESHAQEEQRLGVAPAPTVTVETDTSRGNDTAVTISPQAKTSRQQPAAKSSAMTAGWKLSTTPEDKRAILGFVRDLNDALGEDSNIGVSNLGRALYMMVVKRKEEIFQLAQGRRLQRPDNNDHVALALLEDSLGDLIAEACFHAHRVQRREQQQGV